MDLPCAPGPSLLGLIFRYPKLRRDRLSVVEGDARRFGDIIRYEFGHRRVFLLGHPDHVEQVLETRASAYGRSPLYRRLLPVLGEGLLTAEGPEWSRLRRAFRPCFSEGALPALDLVVREEASRLLDALIAAPSPDLSPPCRRLALRVLVRGRFGLEEPEPILASLEDALDRIHQEVHRRCDRLLPVPAWLPDPGARRLARARDDLATIATHLGRSLMAGGSPEAAAFRGAVEDAAAGGSRNLLDHIMTFLHTGVITLSSVLALTLHALARHPGLQDHITGSPDLAGRVLKESLRLHPPAWMIDRLALTGDTIGGHPIPPGSTMILSPYLVHRHPAVWADPGRFDPDRFLPERLPPHRYAFFPFGAGPRRCIGERYTYRVVSQVMELVASRVRLVAVDPRPPPLYAAITLSAAGALRVRALSSTPCVPPGSDLSPSGMCAGAPPPAPDRFPRGSSGRRSERTALPVHGPPRPS